MSRSASDPLETGLLSGYIEVEEYCEDHSEDERTGGVPVWTEHRSHRIPLTQVREGACVRVSAETELTFLEVSADPPRIRFRTRPGGFSSWEHPEREITLEPDRTVELWDPFRECSKDFCLKLDPPL